MGGDFITVRKYLLKQLNELVVRIEAYRSEAKNELFKERAAGAPFTAHAFTKGSQYICRNYAVEARDATEDSCQASNTLQKWNKTVKEIASVRIASR